MKHKCLILLALAIFSVTLTSCQTAGALGGLRGGGYNDTVNDASLYRSQNRRFRSN